MFLVAVGGQNGSKFDSLHELLEDAQARAELFGLSEEGNSIAVVINTSFARQWEPE